MPENKRPTRAESVHENGSNLLRGGTRLLHVLFLVLKRFSGRSRSVKQFLELTIRKDDIELVRAADMLRLHKNVGNRALARPSERSFVDITCQIAISLLTGSQAS